jgi:hypothetical protein
MARPRLSSDDTLTLTFTGGAGLRSRKCRMQDASRDLLLFPINQIGAKKSSCAASPMVVGPTMRSSDSTENSILYSFSECNSGAPPPGVWALFL